MMSNSCVKLEACPVELGDLDMIEALLDINTVNSNTAVSETNNKQRGVKRKQHLCELDVNSLVSKRSSFSDPKKIEKRNARERNRVRVVNDEFENLRRLVLDSDYCMRKIMTDNDSSDQEAIAHGKKLSKLRVLRLAIEYIEYLSTAATTSLVASNTDCYQANYDTCEFAQLSTMLDEFEDFDIEISMF